MRANGQGISAVNPGLYNHDVNASVLIVEDEAELAQVLRDYLERAGFRVQTVHDGVAAISQFQHKPADIILLDLNLPGMDGLDVARQVRRKSDVPIIMVTARVEETDRLVGLEIGADDYVVKPFSPREVVARVRAVLRRSQASPREPRVLRAADVEVDLERHRAFIGDREAQLTPTEFSLLAALVGQPGRAFTRLQLLAAAQGEAYEGYERTVDAHIKNLRAKIESDPKRPRYIMTVFGVGYRFSDEPA
jgi:two-component system alkaline phosphatase synthesis response regulator PhoP